MQLIGFPVFKDAFKRKNLNFLITIFSFAVTRREENCLHYDEVSKFYPVEYEILFNKYATKKQRQMER